MSVIDYRIVEMKFNNRDFEANAKTSLTTLDKLKNALNLVNNSNLEGLNKAASNADLSRIGASVDAISNRFSTLGVIGMTALSRLTNFAIDAGKKIANGLMGPITSGGFNRAMNLENAKFQLEGLKVAWNDILPDIEHGVNETAYGLDAAAKVAAQLSASGIQTGDAMKNALRGISGVAAMTNSSYEEIGHIFTTVAGNGRMFATELNSIGARGLNAAAALADFFNKVNEGSEDIQHVPEEVQQMVKSISKGAKVGEGEIRDFVSKGKINFEIFSNAMDSAFGEQAKKANETFTGALSNMKSALGRIGAKFATPYLNNMRDIFNSLRVLFNGVNKMIDPIVATYEKAFGGVTKYLTGLIDSGQALNTIQNIITAVRNSFWNFMMVLMPIKEAFREIFPPKTRDDAVAISYALVRLTESMVISEGAADRLKSVFKGFFMVVSTIGDIFKGLLVALKPVGQMMLRIGTSISKLFAHFGTLISTSLSITKANNSISNSFQRVSDILTPICDKIADLIDRLVDKIIFFSKTHITFPSLSLFKKNAEEAEQSTSIFSKVFDVLKNIFSGITAVFRSSLPIFERIGKAIGSALIGISDGFKNAFDQRGFAGVIDLLGSGFLAGIAISLNGFIESLKKNVSSFAFIPSKINGALNNLSKGLKTLAISTSADVVMKMAKAVAVLAGSMLLISMIDSDKLAASMAAITALVIELGVVMNMLVNSMSGVDIFKNIGKGFALDSIAKVISKLGISLLLLAAAMKVLSTMDPEQVIMGLVSIGAILQMISKFTLSMNKVDKGLEITATRMIGLSVGILILSSAVEKLGSIDLQSLAKGLGAVGALLYGVSTFMNSLKQAIGISQGVGVILLATSLVIFSSAIERIGNLDLPTIAKGLIGIGGALAAVGVYMNMVDHAGIGKGTGLILAAVAIKIMSGALIEVGKIPFSELMTGLAGVGASIVIMGVAMSILSDKGLSGAAAMLIMATAMRIFTPALINLSKIPFPSLIKALIALAGGIAIIGGAATLLAPVVVPMLGLAGAITLLGIGALAAGAGIMALGVGLTTLAAGGAAAVAALVSVINTVIGAIPLFLTTLASGILGFLKTLGEGAPLIIETFVSIASGILTAVTTLAPQLSMAAISLFSGFIAAAIAIVPQLVMLGMTIITSLLDGIAQNMQSIVESAIQIVTGFINGIASQLGSIIQAGFNLMISFINGLADGIRNNTEAVVAAGMNLVMAIIQAMAMCVVYFADIGLSFMSGLLTGIVSFVQNILTAITNLGADMLKALGLPSDWVDAAKEFVQGLIDGIGQKITDAVNAVKDLGSKALGALRSVFDSNSPSEETKKEGKNFDDGLAVGIDENSDVVVAAAEEVGKQAKEALESQLAEAAKSADAFASRYGNGLDQSTKKNTSNWRAQVDHAKKAGIQFDQYGKKVESNWRKQVDAAKAAGSQFDEYGRKVKDVAQANDEVVKSSPGVEEALGKTGRAAKSTSKDVKELSESLYNSIESAMDPFTKMELKTEMTSKTLLENMKSQLDGIASWSAKLASLGEKGVSEGLLKYLAELGPQGYEYVNAFSQMTLAEIQKANEMYTAQLAMPAAATYQITDSFRKTGMDVGEGFLQGLKKDFPGLYEAGKEIGQQPLDGAKDALDSHSPSREMMKVGDDTVEGLKVGIENAQAALLTRIHLFCLIVISRFKNELKQDKFIDCGKAISNGIAAGITSDEGMEAIRKAAKSAATTAYDAAMSALKAQSPSRLMMEVGKYFDQGFAIGIAENAGDISRAASAVGHTAIDQMRSIISDIYTGFNDDFNIVISPTLDLSNVRAGAIAAQRMFSSRELALSNLGSSLESQQTGTDGNSFQFIQNNYSPKALSRLDIYRNTKNQFSMMKGAIGMA